MLSNQSLLGGIASLCFLAAFVSYFDNYEGLLSPHSGITPLPANTFSLTIPLSQTIFRSSSLSIPLPPPPLLAFLGVILSSLSTTYEPIRTFAFPIMTTTYYWLVSTANSSGSPFYAFQWDLLLIEAGVMITIQLLVSKFLIHNCQSIASHLPRVLLFKFIFMSGLVKIQSSCPTWLHLTALEYHYATQPLPTTLAWYALNYIPPAVQRLCVAGHFVVEVFAPILLLAPSKVARGVGAKMQIELQIGIAATGNYNFFNLLTVALALGVYFEDDGWDMLFSSSRAAVGNKKPQRSKTNKNSTTTNTTPTSTSPPTTNKYSDYIQILFAYALLALCCGEVFSFGSFASNLTQEQFSSNLFQHFGIMLKIKAVDADYFCDWFIPMLVRWVVVYAGVVGAKDLWCALHLSAGMGRFMKACTGVSICLLHTCVILYPLSSLTPTLKNEIMKKDSMSVMKVGKVIVEGIGGIVGSNGVYLSGSYGLFRRMTGVNHDLQNEYIQRTDEFGWGGLPPSIVARPEIILEGRWENVDDDAGEGEDWKELHFKYKPGSLNEAPKWIAPLHPRLDWQMWFAALSDYNHNPWLINMMHKLVSGDGNEEVAKLMDFEGGDVSAMVGIRAVLYDYDFVRVDNAWNRRIPDVLIDGGGRGGDWWSRKNRREYSPVIGRGDESVVAFLKHYGLYREEEKGRAGASKSGMDEWLGQLKENNGIYSPIIVIFLGAAVIEAKKRGWMWKGRRERRWEASIKKREEEEGQEDGEGEGEEEEVEDKKKNP